MLRRFRKSLNSGFLLFSSIQADHANVVDVLN
jgi:hypothetical protein